jgi:nitric oxide reductase NorD protein
VGSARGPLTSARGDGARAARELREHAALVRQVRHRFERLRARRMRLGAQREGEELDLAAVVRALVERRSGRAGDDRLYVAVRPARRPIAIVLLADVSGSTGLPVDGALRIVDVERIALLLAGEALEALGDPYAMLAFSGRGAADVRVATLKDFGERYGEGARRRVSALEPRGNTRLGAALRHATALLAPQSAGHRLLLLLSDGQPNDSDHYQGDYAVEDSRQAVHEARAKGVFPFCLTVDCEAPEYLPRIFGGAHTVLRQPAQLPGALVEVVRGLVVE